MVDGAAEVLTAFQKSPIGFATEVLGVTPRLHQARILNSIRDHRRTLVVSCNSIGKDFIGGVAFHWYMQSFDEVLVITTAPTGEQVRNIQWKEIRTRMERAKRPLGGKMPEVEPKYWISTNRFAFGISTRDESERLSGHHQAHILIIITEGSAVSGEIFDGIRSLMASGDVRLLVLTNPTRNDGEVWEITQGNRAGWHVLHVDGLDMDNMKSCRALGAEHMALSADQLEERNECPNPTPYLLTHFFEAECREDFGEESDYYKIHVRGLHGLTGSDQLIPRPWIDAAFEREGVPDGKRGGGLDLAKGGRDNNAFAMFNGNLLERIIDWPSQGTISTVTRIRKEILEVHKDLHLAVDDTGMGGGVADVLRQDYPRVFGIDFSEKARDFQTFANRPAEMFFEVRRRLDPDSDQPLSFRNVSPPLRKKFIAHLMMPRYMTEDTKGRLRIDKKGGGSVSPDIFDAVALALEAQAAGRWSGLKIDHDGLSKEDIADDNNDAPPHSIFAGIRDRSF